MRPRIHPMSPVTLTMMQVAGARARKATNATGPSVMEALAALAPKAAAPRKALPVTSLATYKARLAAKATKKAEWRERKAAVEYGENWLRWALARRGQPRANNVFSDAALPRDRKLWQVETTAWRPVGKLACAA